MQENEKNILKQENGGLIPVSKWNEFYPYPTVKSLRQIIFRRKKNGFEKVLRKVGGRLYICEKDYFEWVDSNCRLAV